MEQIEQIEQRLKAATPGPWKRAQPPDAESPFVLCMEAGESIASFDPCGPWVSDEQAIADAEFCAHAPTDIAFLLKERGELVAALKLTETFIKDEPVWNALMHPGGSETFGEHLRALLAKCGGGR